MKSRQSRRAPERTCVVCRLTAAQRELVRISAVEGEVRVDESGKGPGRGAYLCRRGSCWHARGRDARLASALKTKITEADRCRLTAFADARAAEWSLRDNPAPG
jgi:predicted RNA-binding protein YlxR (DUF448 family)